MTCSSCSSILNGLSTDKQQAQRVEASFPVCACEAHSVGLGSPGKVQDDEILYRFIISPGDIDDEGRLISRAFKDAYEDGLSVFRELASDNDIEALVVERLTRKVGQPPRTVNALLKFTAKSARRLHDAHVGRLACVYDETVPRKEKAATPVPTHATLLQRLPAPKTPDLKNKRNQGQERLYNELTRERVNVEAFRDGLIAEINKRSVAGEFVLAIPTAEQT